MNLVCYLGGGDDLNYDVFLGPAIYSAQATAKRHRIYLTSLSILLPVNAWGAVQYCRLNFFLTSMILRNYDTMLFSHHLRFP